MSIEELYNWAKENGYEKYTLKVYDPSSDTSCKKDITNADKSDHNTVLLQYC